MLAALDGHQPIATDWTIRNFPPGSSVQRPLGSYSLFAASFQELEVRFSAQYGTVVPNDG
jgi:hypothetical protein